LPNRFKKFLSAVLCLVIFATNVVLAHAAEANFWGERRKKVGARQSTGAGLNQIARVLTPSLVPRPSSLAKTKLSSLRYSQGQQNYSGLSDSILNFLEILPQQYGSVRKVSMPKKARDEGRGTRDGLLVLHVQDIHQNPEAQNNIARTLQELINHKKIDLIALEGAFDTIDVQPFRDFPYPESIEKVADYLLQENKISGPIHTALRLRSGLALPPIVGIDDEALYNANVEAYKKSHLGVPQMQERLSDQLKELAGQKAKVLNPSLAFYDQQVVAYRQGEITIGSFVQMLSREIPQEEQPDVIPLYLEALDLERNLDFTQVEKERAQLVNQLVTQLDKTQLSELTRLSAAFRMERLSHASFYNYLKNLCETVGIRWAHYPTMASYIHYVLITDLIDGEKLFLGMEEMEEVGYKRHIKTEAEKILIGESKNLHLKEKLVKFSAWRSTTNRIMDSAFRRANVVGMISQTIAKYCVTHLSQARVSSPKRILIL